MVSNLIKLTYYLIIVLSCLVIYVFYLYTF